MENKRTKIAVIVLSLLVIAGITIFALFKTHVLCIHDFSDATCTESPTCYICGDTNGDALGHDFTKWNVTVDPTCSALGTKETTCNRCGMETVEQVEKIPHNDGEWVVTTDYSIDSTGLVTPGTESQICYDCGGTMGTREYTIELTQGQQNALIAANWYLDLHPSYLGTIQYLRDSMDFSVEDATFGADYCGADWFEQAVGAAERHMSVGNSRDWIISYMKEWDLFTDEQVLHGINTAWPE